MDQKQRKKISGGFTRAGKLLQTRINEASAKRGFGETRVLTHWREIVGPATANVCRPVKISYKTGGIGAVLTILSNGAHATILSMQKHDILEKVNACYGYRAIHDIRITQTAPTGFSEGQVEYVAPRQKSEAPRELSSRDRNIVATIATGVEDTRLRAALTELGGSILARNGQKTVRSSHGS